MDYVAKSKRGEDHQNYGYNGRNEVVSARRTLGGSPVAGFDEDFAYDPIGNRVSATDYDETGAARTSTYTANNLNQYTARTVPGWASVRGFADADATVAVNGNPAYMVGRAVPSAPNPDDLAYFFGSDDFDNSNCGGFAELEVSAVVSDGTNDLVSVTTNRVFVPSANETYAYDADGNQTLVTTGTGAWQVEYNGENRPVKWTRVPPDSSTPNSTTPTLVSMTFDHQGRRRLYVEVVAGVTNKLYRFTYDDYVCIARNREVDTQHGVGSDAFVWDPTEPIATRPLMCAPSTETPFFYCHDGNKNVSEAVSLYGTIAAHYEYSSFGKVVMVTSENEDQSTANLNPYRFSSEYADDALDLVYYNYRHYNPSDGRWIMRDPMVEFDAAIVMSYVFCENAYGSYDVLGLIEPSSFLDGIKDEETAEQLINKHFPNDPQKRQDEMRRWKKRELKRGSSLKRKLKKAKNVLKKCTVKAGKCMCRVTILLTVVFEPISAGAEPVFFDGAIWNPDGSVDKNPDNSDDQKEETPKQPQNGSTVIELPEKEEDTCQCNL